MKSLLLTHHNNNTTYDMLCKVKVVCTVQYYLTNVVKFEVIQDARDVVYDFKTYFLDGRLYTFLGVHLSSNDAFM